MSDAITLDELRTATANDITECNQSEHFQETHPCHNMRLIQEWSNGLTEI